jgi:hypothetical protein
VGGWVAGWRRIHRSIERCNVVNGPTVAERLRLNPVATAANDREPRRAVQLEGFAALDNGATFRISVLDLSYDGCKVETPVSLLPGVKLKLSITGLGGALDAAVRWCRDGRAGLRFNPEEADDPATKHTPREHDRVDVQAHLSLRRFGRHHYEVRMFNLAPAGCKVEFVERPKTGEIVWVKFDGLEAVEAVVRWVDGFYGGLEFKRPIYPAVFQILLAKINSRA